MSTMVRGRAAGSRPRVPRPSWRKARRELRPWLLAFPAIAILALLMIYPLVSVFHSSVHENVYRAGEPVFVGLNNYRALFADPIFASAIGHTLVYTVFHVGFVLLFGLLLAVTLNQPATASVRGVARSILLLPWLLATAVVSAVGVLILAPVGLLNATTASLGVLTGNTPWLAQESTALGGIIAVSVWRGYPFIMLMLSAGLQGIAPELYEAATVDGANAWQRLRYITIPQLRGTLFVALLLDTIWSFRLFDLVYIMTGGGPRYATEVIATYTYRLGFVSGQFGAASAAAVVMLLFSLAVATVYLIIERRGTSVESLA